jgi:putative transposase
VWIAAPHLWVVFLRVREYHGVSVQRTLGRYNDDKFICRAICQELAGETVALREIIHARDRQRRELRGMLAERRRVVDSLLEVKRWSIPEVPDPGPRERPRSTNKIKRYRNE